MICCSSSMAGWRRSSRHRRGASSRRAGRRSRYARPSAAGSRRTFPIPTSPRAAGVPTSGTTFLGGGAEDLAYRLANGGYDVVLSPVSNLYFDLAWNQNPEETGLDWGGYVDLRKPFQFIPLDYYRNAPVDPSVFVCQDPLADYAR